MAGAEERQRSDDRGPWWAISVARYRFALPHVVGARVLDVAAGTGYGAEVLAGRARFVAGVDGDAKALVDARRVRRSGSIGLVRADAQRLPFATASFDVVTSFETIEHLEDPRAFVAELARALRPAGVCILSTPNAQYTRPVDGRPRNPFHRHEYQPDELVEELHRGFREVSLYGQRLDPGILVSPFSEDQSRLVQRGLRWRGRVVLWRMLNRLPSSLRDAAARRLWGQSLSVRPADFVFCTDIDHDAPVLVAVCAAPRCAAGA